MAGVKEKLEKARVENQAQIEEMQEQREVEVEEITRNTERIKEQVDGVGEGLKEQLQAEYESVAQQAQDLSDKSKEDYVEPLEPPELQNVEDELPYSLDIFLGAADDLYVVVELEIDDATLCAQPEPPQRSKGRTCSSAPVLGLRMGVRPVRAGMRTMAGTRTRRRRLQRASPTAAP